MKQKPGDRIKVTTSDKEYVGTVMPLESKELVIKLENGYNVGIEKSKIKKIEIIEEYKEKKEKTEGMILAKKELPLISILHTGGTIASKVDYRTGGVVARFTPEDIVHLFPELKEIANIESRLISNMFSEDLRFVHLNVIAEAVVKEIKRGAKGVVITHGTDTMHYSSAGLSFILENCPIPVILVGSQRSSDRPSSDSAINLICAFEFIKQTEFKGVAICMHENMEDKTCLILPACKTRKMHASRRDAFRPINTTAIARVDAETRKVEMLQSIKQISGEFSVKPDMEEKVALIKVHPNMTPDQFSFYKGYKGLIIEGTGLGQAPVGVPNEYCKVHAKILKAIAELVESGTVVAMTTQTIYGTVQMHVYSNAIDLVNAGVVEAKMLPETAFMKLAWLLKNAPKKEIKELMLKDLRGEIFDRIEDNTYLI
jgi:glutamyl-tRNA(Gln) amidotransferase subunit D